MNTQGVFNQDPMQSLALIRLECVTRMQLSVISSSRVPAEAHASSGAVGFPLF